MYKDSPAFQDKEERRLITLASMENLIEFHKIERQEKYNALKFYAAFLGGGIALIAGISKLSEGIEAEIFKYISTVIVVTINLIITKKLIAVRGASNNIYHEYGRRLRYLLNTHSNDLNDDEKASMNQAFQKYIDAQKEGPLFPKHSVDGFEVQGFLFITIVFSLYFWFPINRIAECISQVSPCSTFIVAIIMFAHMLIVVHFSIDIWKNASKMPNISSNKPAANAPAR